MGKNKKVGCFSTTDFFIIENLIPYLLNNFAIAAPISAGDSTTVIPHSLIIFIFAAAVSSAPPTIAPA